MAWRVLAVSIAVCAILGPVFGTAYWGGLSGQPALVIARDIAGVPFVAYAAITVGPFGMLAGVVAAGTCVLLLRSAGSPQRLNQWIGLGAAAGAGLALLMPGVPLALQAPDRESGLFYIGVAVLTGGSCGAIIGAYASSEWKRLHIRPR